MTLATNEQPKGDPALKANAGIVTHLQNMLAQAQAGKITGICLVYLDHNGQVVHAWGGSQSMASVGGLAMVSYEVLKRLDTNALAVNGDEQPRN